MFDGVISDEKIRENDTSLVPATFINVKDKIAKNKREKADVIFTNYALSIKTLILQNKEINLGSFERGVLFDDMGLDSFLTERKNKSGIGLGSMPQFTNLLNVLKTSNKLGVFYKRFLDMAQFIYDDDLLIAIKENARLSLYFYDKNEIYNIFKHYANDLNLTKLVNRYEGNSLRINRDEFLKFATKCIILKFEKLDNSMYR